MNIEVKLSEIEERVSARVRLLARVLEASSNEKGLEREEFPSRYIGDVIP